MKASQKRSPALYLVAALLFASTLHAAAVPVARAQDSVDSGVPATGVDPAVSGTLPFRVQLPFVRGVPLLSTRLAFSAGNPVFRYPEVASLYAGWYLDWGVRVYPDRPNAMEYVQTIQIHQTLTCPLWGPNSHDRTLCPYKVPYSASVWPDLDTISAAARANPGSLWLIGNEMDRRDWQGGGQDEMLPELYATTYHDLYLWLKQADPSARVAVGGVIQATPLRLEYLSKAWNRYQQLYGGPMPVDVWNVHNFILREKLNDWGADIPPGSSAVQGVTYGAGADHIDMGLFDMQIRAFRQWMKDHGQQNKPLVVSEYGVLFYHDGLDDQLKVENFMIATFDYFLNTSDCNIGLASDGCRLVQKWAWYSLDDAGSFNIHGSLFDANSWLITATGRRYRDWSLANLSRLRE